MEGTIYIYAGWMLKEPLIGTADITVSRGKENISFEYDREWLSHCPALVLDPEIGSFRGRQFPPYSKNMFGFLSDASPDRWGRKLMDRREVISARKELRTIRKLFDSDYLLGVHDEGRVGGLRFKTRPQGNYLSDENVLAAPPMTELRRLENASLEYENNKDPYEEKWFRDLLAPGSSLGGARPKANVVDVDGSLWIAKFPSRNDRCNVGAWEMTVHDLAVSCGICVPDARIMHLSEYGDTFLVKRFDRRNSLNLTERIHFASAMTMLGETDGTENPVSYLDIAEILEMYSASAEKDLHELWRRIVFNIAITNSDDHLRNHGFLLTEKGWVLSPAFDMNPVYDSTALSLNITMDDNTRDLNLALEVAPYFRYTDREAMEIIQEICKKIRDNWQRIAARYHIPREEQDLMSQAFTEAYRM